MTAALRRPDGRLRLPYRPYGRFAPSGLVSNKRLTTHGYVSRASFNWVQAHGKATSLKLKLNRAADLRARAIMRCSALRGGRALRWARLGVGDAASPPQRDGTVGVAAGTALIFGRHDLVDQLSKPGPGLEVAGRPQVATRRSPCRRMFDKCSIDPFGTENTFSF